MVTFSPGVVQRAPYVPESTTEVKSTIAGMVVQRKPVSALFNNASQTSNLAYVQLAVVAPPTKILSAVIKNTMQTLPCSPCAIVVKLAQANGAETSAVWSEKLLADQVRENNPGLARLGISPNIFKWCRNNQPMLNEKGYSIRLFVTYLYDKPTLKSLKEFGTLVASYLDAISKGRPNVQLHPSSMFFFGDEKDSATWADLIGYDEAYNFLKSVAGNPTENPNFYKDYGKILDFYFKQGSYNRELAATLGVPEKYLHPSLLDGQPEEDSSDEESVPDDSEKQQHDDDDVDMLSVDDAESVIKVGKNTGVLDDSSDEDDDDEDDDDDSLVDFDVDRDSGK